MIFVFIGPSTQEDEGRYHYVDNFASERQADKFIEEEVKKSKGWYTVNSFIKTQRIG